MGWFPMPSTPFHCLERVNDIRYTFAKDKKLGTGKWNKLNNAKIPYSIEKRQHIDGEMVGDHWMSSYVLFSHIYITTDSKFEKNQQKDLIYVQTMHKYQPVVIVKRVSDGYEEEFRLTMTEFMAVTTYQNPIIRELKKQNN